MATDQNTSTLSIDSEEFGSPIENEIATYRAISNLSIFSLVFGVLSIFCLANTLFFAASVAAIVLGVLAHRSIRKYPDMLTGMGLANAGIALGLVVGLSVATYIGVQTFVRTRMAETFARQYEAVLKTNSLGDMLMLSQHPDAREGKTGEQLVKSMDVTKPKDRMVVHDKYSQLLALNRRLKASKDEHVHFERIETVGVDDTSVGEMPVFALAVFEVEGPGSKEFPEPTQHVLAILKGRQKGKAYDWWVDSIRFPYTPQTYVAPTKAPDDGHGHAH